MSHKQTRETIERYLNQSPRATAKQLGIFLGISRQRAQVRKQGITRPITGYELEILRYIQKDYSNKQIAELVNRSHRTVKNQLNLIFAKLGANNRNHAVTSAINKGLISPNKTQ